MRLATYIEQARELIIEESIVYARQIAVLHDAEEAMLRNHLPLVLDTIIKDLGEPQSRQQSIQRSQGLAPAPLAETAAQFHGTQRAQAGLNIEELVAEYRVLRSCVLRLWGEAHTPDEYVIEDTLRFNEAVDQAIAESVAFHAAELAKWRNLFLGVLGHDLRGPLNAMVMTTEALIRLTDGDAGQLAQVLLRNGRRLGSLLDSLLEYNKSTLGVGMALSCDEVDLAEHCAEEVDIIRRAFPHRQIAYASEGDTTGNFDASRVREALANLVTNAAQHSPQNTAITVTVRGGKGSVEIETENVAEGISPDDLEGLFEPLRRGRDGARSDGNLGLGLFVVREISRAHRGQVAATLTGDSIRFRMTLPKVTG